MRFLLARQLACLPASWPLLQALKTFFNEATAGTLDRVDAAAESSDNLFVSRAGGSQQQDAGARHFTR